ncbi:MAG: helix-turn-helix domain-containing protein [Planctomycetota bacterium]
MNRTPDQSALSPASWWGGSERIDDNAALLSVPEAAKRLGIGVRSLGKLTADDAIPSHKILNRRLYDPAELHAWLLAGAPAEPGSAERIRRSLQRSGPPAPTGDPQGDKGVA